jgi:hypothetical protein
MGQSPRGTAVMAMPPWLWGQDPAAFFAQAMLEADQTAEGWRVRARPALPRSTDALVRTIDLAGPSVDESRFGEMRPFENAAPAVAFSRDTTPAVEQLQRRAEHGAQIGDPTAAFTLHQVQLAVAPAAHAPAAAAEVYEALRATTALEDQATVFPHAGAHLVVRSAALYHRVSLVAVLMRLDQDPKLRAGDVSAVVAANKAGEQVFSSSTELLSGPALLDAYLGPLLGALSPSVWAFSAHRPSGALLYTLGQPIAGTTGSAAELLQVLSVPAPLIEALVPTLSPNASQAAVTWWSRRLAGMFAVLTDPAVFTNGDGTYLPYAHLHAMLSTEQLFRRISSIQSSWRDVNARRVLLFTVLDTLVDGLFASRPFLELCSLPFARATLQRVRDRIPPQAAEVLLPAAERAVAGLEELQNGFFLRRQSGRAQVELSYPGGGGRSLWPDEAAAIYLKVLRNATHGHGSNQANQVATTNAMLAQHNGHGPHELTQLGYLYLLELLSDPAMFKRNLRERVRA